MNLQPFIIFFICLRCSSGGVWEHSLLVRPQANENLRQQSMDDLFHRVLGPEGAAKFKPIVTSSPSAQEMVKIFKDPLDGAVVVEGNTSPAVGWGLNYYLKYYCRVQITWETTPRKYPLLPDILPDVNVTLTAFDSVRYYENVCTWSYSFSWWTWTDWERHIDWMTLNGINMALAFSGQEEVWRRVYLELGLTDEEVDDHFAGPAFLAWGRMGNMRGWGGPLGPGWRRLSSLLNRQSLARMRSLGITPVLPAFTGQLPRAIKRIFPNASLEKLSQWNDFTDEYCCPYLLSPVDPLFITIGSMFLREYIADYGSNHVYSCDPFNELTPSSGNVDYIKSIGESIFSALTTIDPKAIWLLQGWMFFHEMFYWTRERTEAFLKSAPRGRMLILDLQSDIHPQYQRLDYYFGQPFVWCMLHNFGGTLGMQGSIEIINEGVATARTENQTSMVGSGLTPEGIFQNYVMYDFMMETAWRTEPVDLEQWFNEYAHRRYGVFDENASRAWQMLKLSVYNYTGSVSNHGKYVFVRSPSLKLKPNVWYRAADVYKAWYYLLKAGPHLNNLPSSSSYIYDVVDVTRQSLQLILDYLYTTIVDAFYLKDLETLGAKSEDFLGILEDLDTILGTHEDFLLGKWIEAAKSIGETPLEKRLLEKNARNQVTLWGPNGEISDYANKQWAGLVNDYYKPRWGVFFEELRMSVSSGSYYNQTKVSEKIFYLVEQPFTYSRKIYPNKATGDSLSIANGVYAKWCLSMSYCILSA